MFVSCKQYPLIKNTDFDVSFNDVSSCEKVKNNIRNKLSTNEHFKSFTQSFRTLATDTELDMLIKSILEVPPSKYIDKLESLKHIPPSTRALFDTLDMNLGVYEYTPESVVNTLKYIFKHHKRGIFVQIRNGQLRHFCPFSNANYMNNLSKKNIYLAKNTFSHTIKQNGWIRDPSQWYTDGCLIKPGKNWICNTPDWYYAEYYYLLQHMLKRHKRHVNDVDFIINTANFPLFRCRKTKKGIKWFHPHEMLVDSLHAPPPGTLKIPCPVFSAFKSQHNDIYIPSGYDIDMASGKVFLGTSSKSTGCSYMFPKLEDNLTFSKKLDKIVWRGALSNCGGDRKTSCRFKIASIQSDILDAKITDASTDAVRKTFGSPIATTAKVKPIEVGQTLSRNDFLKFKYVMMLGGTNTNASLPYFLQSNSVVIYGGDNKYKMWYSDALKPNQHYLGFDCDANTNSINEELSKIVAHGKTKDGQKMYKNIVMQAQSFYKRFLNMNVMADYLYIQLNSITYTHTLI